MFLKTIVCSGINEKNEIKDAVEFLKTYQGVEFGVQCSPKKAGYGTPRFEWIDTLASKLCEQKMCGRLALHLNEGFAVSICEGVIPPEISDLLQKTNAIGRLQLNFKIGREVFGNNQIAPDLEKLATSMAQLTDHDIILSASKANLALIAKMYHQGFKFDALFDDSFGEGIQPKAWSKPLFEDVFQGYAGGLSPENIQEELEKISKVATGNIFIDAEGKLKQDGAFSFARAEQYVKNAKKQNSLIQSRLAQMSPLNSTYLP